MTRCQPSDGLPRRVAFSVGDANRDGRGTRCCGSGVRQDQDTKGFNYGADGIETAETHIPSVALVCEVGSTERNALGIVLRPPMLELHFPEDMDARPRWKRECEDARADQLA